MAHPNLPAFPLGSFPQSIVEQEIMRVNRILARVYAQNQPELCCWESPESHVGACDGGFPCNEIATEDGYCKQHYLEVNRD